MPTTAVAVLVAVVAVAVGVVVGVWGFLADSRPLTVGAHSGSVSPTADGWATVDLGGVLPALRLDSGLPLRLGVRLDVTATEVATLDEVVSSDAVIASAPEGEIAEVRSTVREMALVHAARGLGAAVLVAVALGLALRGAGAARLRAWWSRLRGSVRRPASRPSARTVTVTLLVLLGLVGLALPSVTREDPPGTAWAPLTELFPEAASVPGLDGVQLSDGPETRGAAALIRGAIDTYEASRTFYSELAGQVPEIADRLRDPREGEQVALHVSDRHDNVGMDATVAAVAEAGGAELLLDTGDDTSAGAAWESFSIDSLAEAADGLDVVAVPGNHDFGGTVGVRMSELGFTVLDGEPVDVAGIRFLGDADPRASSYTPTVAAQGETVEEQADRLADVACADGEISTVLVHDPVAGAEVAERGCADLVLSGHLHRQVGPTAVVGDDGRVTTTYTGGTTGGAAFAIALGSKLRRPAQLTLVTYRDGEPIGLQPIDVTTGGTFEVQAWQPLPPPVGDPPAG